MSHGLPSGLLCCHVEAQQPGLQGPQSGESRADDSVCAKRRCLLGSTGSNTGAGDVHAMSVHCPFCHGSHPVSLALPLPQARDRYVAQRAALKAAAVADPSSSHDSLPSYKPPPSPSSSPPQSPHERAAAEAAAEVDREAAVAAAAGAAAAAAVAAGGGCSAPSRRALARLQSMSLDDELDEYYGQVKESGIMGLFPCVHLRVHFVGNG